MYSLWIGWDPHEVAAFDVARISARVNCSLPAIPIRGVVLEYLRKLKLYSRPTELHAGTERDILWDVVSGAPMSTEFAISRFFVPILAKIGMAMFTDCDVMFRGNISSLLQNLNGDKAVYCVKHSYVPKSSVKMDGQPQTFYPRKNWSSVMVFNCEHPANRALTPEFLNKTPGRDLHRFCWLDDHQIGELDPSWNWLVGEQPEPAKVNLVHWTNGGPWLERYKDAPYADEWHRSLRRHAA